MEGANVVHSHDDHQQLVLGGCYACRLTGVIFAEFTEITQLTKPQIPPVIVASVSQTHWIYCRQLLSITVDKAAVNTIVNSQKLLRL